MDIHIATAYEQIAAALPDSAAAVQGTTTRSWAEFDERAARLATGLLDAGLGPGSKVGLYLTNCVEYLEAFYAAFKIRGIPVNINYRYVDAELAHLVDDSDAEAVVFPTSLAPRVANVAQDRDLKLLVQVTEPDDETIDGAVSFEQVIAQSAPAEPVERSADDHYLLYTGGTTGLPKGVVYEIGGLTSELVSLVGPFLGGGPIDTLEGLIEVARGARESGASLSTLILPPLMHGTAMGVAMMTQLTGGTVVLADTPSFDPEAALSAIESQGASLVTLVGDAFARPMLATLRTRSDAGTPVDLSSLRLIMSAGAMLSAESKKELLEHAPQALILDTLAASEGAMGTSITSAAGGPETSAFSLREGTRVIDDADIDVEPGSGQIGRLAVPTKNPIGYYKDPEKTAATFPILDGVRHSIPGDWAVVESDGSIRLLGRGNQCINSAGEKIFPEEVEEALKTHTAVMDALVFGVDDQKWGQRVEAVVSLREAGTATEEQLVEHSRANLAGYKLPKHITFVETVPRAPNGKADYRRARELAGR